MNEIENQVNVKLEADTEFQSSLASLSDEDKATAIETKRKELIDSELVSLREKAESSSKNEELAKNYKTRAEKAENDAKKPVEKKIDGFSTKDILALTKADVPEEDIDEVVDYAKFKGISVADALKSSVVKSTLAEKAEVRKTAQATATRQTRPQNTTPDGYSILENAKKKGEDAIPEGGSKDSEALFAARYEQRTGRKYIAG